VGVDRAVFASLLTEVRKLTGGFGRVAAKRLAGSTRV